MSGQLDKLLYQYLKLAAGESESGGATLPLTASIVLCTLDRPQELSNCLHELSHQHFTTSYEVIVVDNNPASGLTAPIAQRYPVRYLGEKRRGLSYARNAGIKAAGGDVIICIDDDVSVTQGWLDALLEPFKDSKVMAVTGAVLPKDLDNYSAELFEEYGGLFRGFERIDYGRNFFRRKFRPVQTWDIGATANAAFRAEIFARSDIGPFHEALGTGSPTGCSEDTYVFYKILKAGYHCVYQPKALVYHSHRQDMQSLRKQLYNYSKGHIAYQLMTLLYDRDWRVLPYLLILLPLKTLRRVRRYQRKYTFYPPKLVLLETWGYLNGPLALWQALQRTKKLGRTPAHEIAAAWQDKAPL